MQCYNCSFYPLFDWIVSELRAVNSKTSIYLLVIFSLLPFPFTSVSFPLNFIISSFVHLFYYPDLWQCNSKIQKLMKAHWSIGCTSCCSSYQIECDIYLFTVNRNILWPKNAHALEYHFHCHWDEHCWHCMSMSMSISNVNCIYGF